jgi:hypothetical protein
MHHDEIISQLAEKNQKILYIGTPDNVIAETVAPSFFQSVDPTKVTDAQIAEVANDFDTVIFTDALEKVDDPFQLLSQLKWHAKSAIVYEFKYDHMDSIDASWKQPWKHNGLENILTWEFDYVRSLYLGYATIYFCEGPNKDVPKELAKNISAEQV